MKSPEKELNAMDASNVLATDFKIMIIRMLKKKLRGRMEELRENINKEIVDIKKKQKS